MDLEIFIRSEVRQRQTSYDITYMQNLIIKWPKQTYLQNRNRSTDIENKLMVSKGEGWGAIKWELGIDICTLLYSKTDNQQRPTV